MRRFAFTTKDGRSGVVRPARRRDAKDCLAIVWEATHERPRTLMTSPEEFWSPRQWRKHRHGWDPDGVTLVAEVVGRVVANLGCERGRRPRERHLCEFGVTVARRYRGMGVGTALLEALEAWAREAGVEKIMLRAFDTNTRARSLYERLGYTTEGIERLAVKFPDEYIDTVRMGKFVGGPAAPARADTGRSARKRRH